MKKILLAIVLVGSTAVLTGCGFNNGCCNTCSTGCATTVYSYSGTCGYSMCSRSWY